MGSMKNCRHIKFPALTVIIILFVCNFAAYAENRAGTFNITPYMGWYDLDGDLPYDDEFTWGIGVGLNFTEKIGAEFNFNSVSTQDNENDTQIFLYRLDLLYHLTGILPEKVVPYVAAGAGFTTYEIDQRNVSKDSNFIINSGIGLKYFLTKNTAFRGDMRYIRRGVWNSGAYNNFLYTAGVTFEFGGQGREPEVIVPTCPPSPPGCFDKDWCKKDTDGDGVPDCIDKCPNTPAGCAVDKDGCPIDSDGDGVPDCIDKCPNTPEGTEVDADGCMQVVEQGAVIFLDVLFDFGKADLRPVSFPVLDEVTNYLKANPDVKMEIHGHTDNTGSAEYNMKLSNDRANSVKNYLVEKGISPERIQARGFGLTMPIFPNDIFENRAKNRRVEFKIIQ
jgi:OOP family OmpA-OmpF porin